MYPMCCFTRSGSRATSNPATVADPEVGWRRPQSILMVVDLPAPLGPRNPKISPLDTWRSTASTAVKAPKRFVSLLSVTEVSPVISGTPPAPRT